jgi:CBS domain-containing protein
MKVREIMTSGSLATATLDTTIEEIANMMKAEDVGAIPVLDDEEKLAGIITDRDIVVRAIAEGEDPTECTAEDILTEQLHTIQPEADLAEAIALMSQHQIRRLPVVEEEQVIGIISLGDVSVKSQTEQAGEALEDISEGVRQQSEGDERQDAGRNLRQASGGERERTNGAGGERAESGGDERPQRQSSGEEVAEEEAEYQGGGKATSIRRGTAQMGGSRAKSKPAGRGQNAGGGQAPKRASQQNVTARGRRQPSARGRDAGSVRGENAGRATRGNKQGIGNRSARQENQRQQKVAPMRAESKAGRSQSKRRAS